MKGELTIVYEPAEEGGWVVSILEYPGAVSQGETLEEAREMILDAMNELMLSYRDTNSAEYAERNDIIREHLTWNIHEVED